jgi:hypothetical protein
MSAAMAMVFRNFMVSPYWNACRRRCSAGR